MTPFLSRLWRGWCIVAFAYDPNQHGTVDALRDRCADLENELINIQCELSDWDRRIDRTLYRADDADEP